jgi:hypothetical protein
MNNLIKRITCNGKEAKSIAAISNHNLSTAHGKQGSAFEEGHGRPARSGQPLAIAKRFTYTGEPPVPLLSSPRPLETAL